MVRRTDTLDALHEGGQVVTNERQCVAGLGLAWSIGPPVTGAHWTEGDGMVPSGVGLVSQLRVPPDLQLRPVSGVRVPRPQRNFRPVAAPVSRDELGTNDHALT